MNIFCRLIFIAAFLISWALSPLHSYAQNTNLQKRDHAATPDNSNGFDEKKARETLKKEGLSDAAIDKWMVERKLKAQEVTPFSQSSKTPVVNASGTCSDMGAEGGWSVWQAATGDYASTGVITFNATGLVPTAPRFNLTSGAGVDPCTPGGGGPPLPVVAPGFGNASIQLGQPQTNGFTGGCSLGCVEQLTFNLQVVPADTNFIYTYAVILENPAGHSITNQPFAEIYMLDKNGDTVKCSHHKYVGDINGGVPPGMYRAACTSTGGYGMDVAYLPWTVNGIDLAAYIGQTLKVVIINADCAQGGHYCYSYWDFMCPPVSGTVAPFCLGQQTTITGPVSTTFNPYTYQWYHNGTILPGATSQIITPTPLPGDTFSIHVMQSSGCSFWMPFVPEGTTIVPDFSHAGSCGKLTFTDSSRVLPVSATNTVVAWNWQFPGGNPATSTSQNPGTIVYPPGTYTVTLIVTSTAGCKDTIKHTFTVVSLPPVANFSAPPVCMGNPTPFTNLSSVSANAWNWNFGDGSAASTLQNPTHTYSAAGTYTVTLIATAGICGADTISIPVTVNALPVANMKSPNVCFNNANVFTDLSVGNTTLSTWAWNFGDGNKSVLSNPTHTYGNPGTYAVTLTVTNTFGCVSSQTITVVVNPLPVANFSSPPVCLHDITCFGNSSSISSGSVTGWSWNFGDAGSGANNISNLKNPCHTFTGMGPFTVILTVTSDSGCQSTTSLPATLNPLPMANFIPTPVCLGLPTVFTDISSVSGGIITGWNWTFGDGSAVSAQQNPTHIYSPAGSYTVTLVVTSSKGCKDTVNKPITVYNLPVAAFSSADSGCAPVCKTFQDLSQAGSGSVVSWQWSFPSGGNPSSSTVQSGSSCWKNPGSYGVGLIVSNTYGCKDTLYIPNYINVFPWPKADFCIAPAQAPSTDPVFTFCPLWTPNPGVTNWVWNFGDNSPLDNVNTNPVHSYSATTTGNDFYSYNVCLRVQNQHGCWDTICKPVELIPYFTFYIPNCVTPNQDGTNEFFFGKGRGIKDYNIWVFDRWGNQLWDCHYQGKNTDWDNTWQDGMPSACKWDCIVVPGGMDMGGNSGEFAQEDVYVWKVRLTDIFDKIHNYIGRVSIVK
jgi:PKD repeat protein